MRERRLAHGFARQRAFATHAVVPGRKIGYAIGSALPDAGSTAPARRWGRARWQS
ncbi:hypothetical protein BSIN_3114 [Burkholderia singularis]|uniref:Uncharacterized protein n=1 Tax=Burkholderia singularis TaxID=1503053 RepID=A0A238H3N5_9BURK|nr:hypothetical protein BSIN_3114 [Burkholderia singularis]